MKALAIASLLLLSGLCARAQPSLGIRQDFKFSRVVLVSGDTLDGPVSMRFSPDMLYIRQADGTVRTLVPAQVAAFVVQGQVPVVSKNSRRSVVKYDPSVVRLFRTVLWTPKRTDQRPEPAFFEQLSQGPVLLLRRQSYVRHSDSWGDTGPGRVVGRGIVLGSAVQSVGTVPRTVSVRELWDAFYLAWPTGEIKPLQQPKKDLRAAFPNQAQQLDAYAKRKKLRYSNAAQLHELVDYANSLASTSSN